MLKGDKQMDNQKVATVDEYIEQFSEQVQVVLMKIREVIREVIPTATEKMSYQMPTYYLKENLVHFAAYKKHIGFYPTPSAIAAFREELSAYKWAKGSVQFPIDEPIPYELIQQIVEFRVREVMGQDEMQTDYSQLLEVLANRFKSNMHRHKSVAFSVVKERLLCNEEALKTVYRMEESGGEPDVVVWDEDSQDILFVDCAKETPVSRRNVCYDREALEKRKDNKPPNNAVDMSEIIGASILTVDEYARLQKIEEFDLKTSSWVETPDSIRKLGGAIFCDRRYDTVFTYHNSAQSYYGVRGFRCLLRIT